MLPFLAKPLARYAVGAGLLAVLAGGYLWHRHSLISAGIAQGEAQERSRWLAAQDIATAEHNARLAQAEEAHNAATQTLRQERDAALARPAVIRRIRVPVAAVCPAASPGDAGVSEPDPGDGLLEIDDPGYPRFRDWLVEFAGRPADGG